MVSEEKATLVEDAPESIRSSLGRLFMPIYAPAFLATLAQTIALAVLPLYLLDVGASTATVGAVVSMEGLGSFLSAGGAGFYISRVGERNGMVSGSLLRCVGYALCVVAGTSHEAWTITTLYMARFASGVGTACFQIARQSWVAAAVRKEHRGRVNALIGGCTRIASSVAPAVGGMAAHARGASFAFGIQLAVGLLTVLNVALGIPMPVTAATGHADGAEQPLPAVVGEDTSGAEVCLTAKPSAASRVRQCFMIRCKRLPSWFWPLIAIAPIGFSFAFVRAARSLLIPLKAHQLDLSESEVGLVTSASFVCDSIVFPAGGFISDACARQHLSARLPCPSDPRTVLLPAASNSAIGSHTLGRWAQVCWRPRADSDERRHAPSELGPRTPSAVCRLVPARCGQRSLLGAGHDHRAGCRPAGCAPPLHRSLQGLHRLRHLRRPCSGGPLCEGIHA